MWSKMSELSYLTGPEITLVEMLSAREQRVMTQQTLLKRHPEMTLVTATLRIPGPIKTSVSLQALMTQLKGQLQTNYQVELVEQRTNLTAITGPELYFVLAKDAQLVKQEMISLEAQPGFYQLCDLDVLIDEAGELRQVNRERLQLARRQCLVCGQDAKVCSRSRQHGLSEVQTVIDGIIEEEVLANE
ncbi:Apo-citrate lyase phosphoribosyl-dephospho-CoA transferase [Latilactobacillus fuchuensis]|uniref:citrate lyase holo-[acyl-carrier protein] synthase n=2 Tax=Latilactobacillus fuchuensis TaxID=164393 RepID=A0A2N9DY90_9LACO|nr:Apo-citrate lyase phosphoribosyl-dephospho-CoA transferase [Latilactobacillus fuchuensis]